ncbi:MAG: Mur ligase family protein [Acidobacteriota bacterium]
MARSIARTPARTSTKEKDRATGILADLPRFGRGIGLHRSVALLEPLVDQTWWRRLDAIKVTGSYGKGSVATMIAAILHAADIPCGLFTSPHLRSFEERIQLDGEPIEPAVLDAAAGRLRSRLTAYKSEYPQDKVGYFEALTALACYAFAEKKPAALVAEAGIGGRFDPTRVIPGQTTVLTGLDHEHVDLLGGSLETIAYDKLDLASAGGTLLTGRLSADLVRRLRGAAQVRGISLKTLDDLAASRRPRLTSISTIADLTVDGSSFEALEINAAGEHQIDNAALAAAAASHWLRRNHPEVDIATAIRIGLGRVRLPGRFQRVHRDPDVWIDLAHTPRSIAASALAAHAVLSPPVILVTGLSTDKDYDALLSPLLPLASRVIVTRARHRGAPVGAVAARAHSLGANLVDTAPVVETALAHALARARAEDRSVLVAGGFFLAAEALAVLEKRDPSRLAYPR